jgi:hypothetical protein
MGFHIKNIEPKNEILTMQAKLHYISKNIVGKTFKVVGIKRVGCHLVLNLECWSSTWVTLRIVQNLTWKDKAKPYGKPKNKVT